MRQIRFSKKYASQKFCKNSKRNNMRLPHSRDLKFCVVNSTLQKSVINEAIGAISTSTVSTIQVLSFVYGKQRLPQTKVFHAIVSQTFFFVAVAVLLRFPNKNSHSLCHLKSSLHLKLKNHSRGWRDKKTRQQEVLEQFCGLSIFLVFNAPASTTNPTSYPHIK